MIVHALEEGFALLRRRGAVSVVLALSLAVPLSLAGFTISLVLWSQPLVELENENAVVRVLLHPRMDGNQRKAWVAEQASAHPEWLISEVDREVLEEQLEVWFPYLEDLLDGENAIDLPTLVQVETSNPDEVSLLSQGPAVIAVGPTSSIDQVLGMMAQTMTYLLGGLCSVLLASAFLLAATWIHLEVFRHADEITIMRLVGATESSIRSPFIVASLIPGLFAGVFAAAGSWFLVRLVAGAAAAVGLSQPIFPSWVLAVEIGTGMLLPVVAAMVTMARHARVSEPE